MSMQQVHNEVEQIWGERTPYSRTTIKYLLANWREELESSSAMRSLNCAMVRGEIIGIVKTLPYRLRWFFDLYIRRGYTYDDLHDALGWSDHTCDNRYAELVKELSWRMCNPTSRAVDTVERKALIPERIVGCAGDGESLRRTGYK